MLLDAATFLWICLAPAKLSALAIRLYEDPENDVFLSAASTYEIIVKTMIGKLDLGVAPSVFVRAEREKRGIEPLAIDESPRSRSSVCLRFTQIRSTAC